MDMLKGTGDGMKPSEQKTWGGAGIPHHHSLKVQAEKLKHSVSVLVHASKKTQKNIGVLQDPQVQRNQ